MVFLLYYDITILLEKFNFISIHLSQAVRPFSASIFLGFDADPSLNIAARIRGINVCFL